MLRSTLVCLLATLPHLVLAEEQAAAASIPVDPPKPLKVRPVSLRPADAGYPVELATNGVQGTSEILVKLGADGAPIEFSVRASSRSAALDQAALAVVRDLKFTVKDPAKPVGELIVPVEFMRDSVATLSKKTCAEFNADVAYFKTTFPELETRRMTVINMTVGTFASFGLTGLSQERSLAYIKRLEAAAKGVVDACAKDPEAGYTKTFTRLVKDSGG